MTDAPPSEKHVDALLQFYQEAQVDSAKAKRGEETAETPQLYSLQALVPAAKLKEGEKSYERLLNTFGESLDLKVGVKDNDENWTILYVDAHRGTVERADFAHLPEHPADLNLEISIDKCALIQKLKLDQTRYNCFFYLFEENLVTFLSAPLLNLDGLLFSETCPQAGEQNKTSENDKPVLILLSETDVHFAGEMLTIVSEPRLAADSELMATLQGQQPAKTGPAGASVTADQENPTLGDYVRSALNFLSGKQAATPPQAPSPSAPLSGTLQEQIQKYRATARETPSLIGGQFEHLTPLHFLGQWRIKHSALEKILAIHFVNICILYTASRSTIDADRNPVESVYNSADRTAILNLKEAPESAISTATLESLARWLYSGKGTDQRTVFQNIIARELYGDDATATYNNFIARIPRLWKDTVWQYQVFVDGRITKHFEEWQKMRGYVAEVNKKISEAIDSITKGLTDTLLATIGVLVLTVLAALVKKDTSIEIFKISMGVYSIYLLFYAVYRMGSTGHSYRLLSNEAGVQLSEYRAALGLEEITDISLPLKRRRRQFHIWFWLTVVLYLVLGGSIWWAGKKGPQLLIDRGIITAPGAKAAEASSSVFGMQPIPSTNSESNSNSDASGDRIVRKMGVDYQKLSERYANFLVAVGGVSITVLAVVLSLGESDSSGSKSASRAFLVAALLAATVSCFIGAHMMAETSAAIDASKGELGERLFLLASTNIFVAISLVLFALMLLLTTSGKVDAYIIRPISVFVFVSVVVGAFIWMVLTARLRMPAPSGWYAIVLPALIIAPFGFLPCFPESSTKKLSLLFIPIVFVTVVILLLFAWTFDDRGEVHSLDICLFVSAVTFTYASLVVAGIKRVCLTRRSTKCAE